MKNKGTSEKRGISLIVLVITIIVIIILAVAVILSIANNNPIENAKEARFRNDMKVIEEELNLYIAKKYADDLGNSTEVVNLDGENMVKALPSTKDYKDKVKIVGGNLELTGSASEEEREWAEKIGIEVGEEIEKITFSKKETGDLALKSEVTASNGENFYVIGGDTVGTEISNSTKDILLLAKYNLTSDGSSQDKTGEGNYCAFSSTNYWSSVSGIAYPDSTTKKYPDLNDVEKYPIGSATSIITKAKAYGETLGVTGRLMTYEEAKALETNYSEILYGKNTEKGYLHYWLGSAVMKNSVWYVDDEVSFAPDGIFLGETSYGVRPVIEVPKSSIN